MNLADTLTWGAFTYPIAFLVTDLTNRRFGPAAAARKVVVSGFTLAIIVPMLFWTGRRGLHDTAYPDRIRHRVSGCAACST